MALVDDIASVVRAGYAFDTPSVTLGPLVVDGKSDAGAIVRIPMAMLSRHGLVAGATGTGKTKTLQVLAEQLDVEEAIAGQDTDGDPGASLTGRPEPGPCRPRW